MYLFITSNDNRHLAYLSSNNHPPMQSETQHIMQGTFKKDQVLKDKVTPEL
jgi:hypothetical protein